MPGYPGKMAGGGGRPPSKTDDRHGGASLFDRTRLTGLLKAKDAVRLRPLLFYSSAISFTLSDRFVRNSAPSSIVVRGCWYMSAPTSIGSSTM